MIDEALRAKYRLTFLKDEVGISVLSDILYMCHFGCSLDPDNKVHEVYEHNIGIAILYKLGILEPDTLHQVVNALTAVTPPKPKEEKLIDPLGDFR